MRRAVRWLWLFPMVAAVVFAMGVLLWAYRADRDEAQERRSTLIADALSTEAQLRARAEVEFSHVQDIAAQLPKQARNVSGLAAIPEVAKGLRGMWLSVTWLDDKGRTVAHLPEQLRVGENRVMAIADTSGMSAHFTSSIGSDRLVVRYSPVLLLRRGTPWWLARKYEVQLIDSSEMVVASVEETPVHVDTGTRESYRVLVGKNMPGVFLELTLREPPRPFWRALPLILIVGFLLLMGVATVLLRRQVRQISFAEVAWRTEAAWRQAMEDSALVGLRARDAEGRILYVNRTFCEMVGLPADKLLGLRPPMPYWPPEAIDEVMLRNRRNLAGHAPREGYETRWVHQDGRTLEVMVFESALIDANGTQVGWMGSIIDITAKKTLERRERHQAEAMAYQARLTTLGEVASALAHQLNQPLTAITGYNAGVQHMLQAEGFQNPVILQALKSQGEQAVEAGRIVRRIREFLTRRAPQREKCSVEVVARRAMELLQRDLTHQHIGLQWAIPADLPEVYADPVLIEQVLINLVRNAADAVLDAQGSGHVRISGCRVGAQFVRIDVDDSGPGLEGRSIEQLTTAFYSTKTEGMGMGLAICRSVVEVHHGAMDAVSLPGGGARLSFTLPVFVAEHDAALQEDASCNR